MTNWICLECDKIFNADSSESFSSEDVECPRCGAGWEMLGKLFVILMIMIMIILFYGK